MLDWLGKIWCAIVQLPERIADWLVALMNLFIAGLAAAAGAALALLPDMPDVPGLPGGMVEGLSWANWFLPVGTLVTQLGVVVGLVIVFASVSIILRWIKAH